MEVLATSSISFGLNDNPIVIENLWLKRTHERGSLLWNVPPEEHLLNTCSTAPLISLTVKRKVPFFISQQIPADLDPPNPSRPASGQMSRSSGRARLLARLLGLASLCFRRCSSFPTLALSGRSKLCPWQLLWPLCPNWFCSVL